MISLTVKRIVWSRMLKYTVNLYSCNSKLLNNRILIYLLLIPCHFSVKIIRTHWKLFKWMRQCWNVKPFRSTPWILVLWFRPDPALTSSVLSAWSSPSVTVECPGPTPPPPCVWMRSGSVSRWRGRGCRGRRAPVSQIYIRRGKRQETGDAHCLEHPPTVGMVGCELLDSRFYAYSLSRVRKEGWYPNV